MITIVRTTNPKTPILSIEAPAFARLCCKLRIPKFKVSSKPFTFTCRHSSIHVLSLLYAYIHTYYMHAYIHTYSDILIYIYLSTYIHTFIHACMHTFIHTVQDMYIFSREADVCT